MHESGLVFNSNVLKLLIYGLNSNLMDWNESLFINNHKNNRLAFHSKILIFYETSIKSLNLPTNKLFCEKNTIAHCVSVGIFSQNRLIEINLL